jgi:large subunit ribosomal protein L29
MSFSKIKDILSLTDEEIRKEILLGKKQLFELRLKQGTRQSFKSHSFGHIKHRLGQLLMVKSQRRPIIEEKD